MSDPLENLKHLDEGVAGPALPASEVRRRGDRMRRRRTALRVAAAACAVAVVTTGGIALGGGGLTSSPPTPPPASQDVSPTPDDASTPRRSTQALTVPADFPLDEGMPRVDADSERKTRNAVGGPHLFDPCHNNEDAATEPGRTDLRQVVQAGPAYAVVRELAVYDSSSAANEALLLMKGERERCAVYTYEDGISKDVWEVSPLRSADVPADDRLLGVNRALTEGIGFMTPATHWTVARVGNAILTLGYDGEFGADQDGIARVAAQEAAVYRAVVGALCPFADDGTDIGCDSPSTGATPGPVEDPGPAYLLDEETLRKATGVEEFATTPDAQMATLACQAEWLGSLGADTADYRQFEARTDDGELSAWAGTAVLGFRDAQAAGTAYDTVGEWVSQCEPQVDTSHRLVTAVGTGIGEPHLGDTSAGPYFWRGVKLTAPERCVECDAAWDDHQGAVQVGSRLVLLHVALAGDLQAGVDDSRLPLEKLLETLAGQTPPDAGAGGKAGGEAGTALPPLGPDGWGALELGMTATQAERTGAVTLEDSHGQGCTTFGLLAEGRQRAVGTGFLSADLGVAAIFAEKDLRTPEGIGVGSSQSDVRTAYPRHQEQVNGWSVPVPGHPDRTYVVTFLGGEVDEIALALRGQDCFG